MSNLWQESAQGVLPLPSGKLVRGRGWRDPIPDGPAPHFGLYPLGQPPPVDWEFRWLKWRDFWLPSDRAETTAVIREAWQRCAHERVEIACKGGVGRTGTVLACLAVLDGLTGSHAIAYVREHYNRRAVETPWQRRYVVNAANT